ncbi:hypothetical protein DFH08DRAFT_1021918 [Mycena albidolilacea]|uniref:Glycan binding protein Y3-like domain-containing protein n=1 Tax=Mycena albidolilacea TaxID=1033008 RepID=A0AAD6ZMY8_9AGAR|nr:hypothetical protein DFH08DRAFT_1021918 [Mycena albidolilacea]
MLSNARMMLGLVSFALITKPSRAYPPLRVNCESLSSSESKIDCSQFFPAFCGSVGDEPVPPGSFIKNFTCFEDQSLGASCNIFGTNGATTPQVPSEKICFEALTTVNKTCIGSFGFAQAKGDGFIYTLQPLTFVCTSFKFLPPAQHSPESIEFSSKHCSTQMCSAVYGSCRALRMEHKRASVATYGEIVREAGWRKESGKRDDVRSIGGGWVGRGNGWEWEGMYLPAVPVATRGDIEQRLRTKETEEREHQRRGGGAIRYASRPSRITTTDSAVSPLNTTHIPTIAHSKRTVLSRRTTSTFAYPGRQWVEPSECGGKGTRAGMWSRRKGGSD